MSAKDIPVIDDTPVQETAAPEAAAAPANFWQLLAAISKEPRIIPIPRQQEVTLMGLEDYQSILFSQIGEVLAQLDGTGEWKCPVQYNRLDDIRYAFVPELTRVLRSYAADGKLQDLIAIPALAMLFTLREMIRLGKLPVLVPLQQFQSPSC